MRTIATAFLSILVASAQAAGPLEPVDLNRPGALDQVRMERPAHYEAISQVLRVVERVPCKDREVEALKVRYDVRDMACNFLVLTSFPAKRRMSFALEDTSYTIVVTLKDAGGRFVPLKLEH